MKKFISIMLILTMIILVIPSNNASAATSSYRTYFDDGSYAVTTITTINTLPNPFSASTYATASTTQTSSKTVRYYNSANQVMWYISVIGSFTFNGSTSRCNSSSVDARSCASTWKVTKLSASHSGNTAYASCEAIHYMGSLEVNRISRVVSLSCSPNGVYS